MQRFPLCWLMQNCLCREMKTFVDAKDTGKPDSAVRDVKRLTHLFRVSS
jgi:hypothetical protein